MDQIDEILKATDNGWAITALLIVASTFLAWKLGIPVLNLLRENLERTKNAQATTEEIKEQAASIVDSIQTNHGSKNLGDAVDRLTEWFLEHMKDSKEEREMVKRLHHTMLEHLVEAALKEDKIGDKLADLDDRVAAIEAARHVPPPRMD